MADSGVLLEMSKIEGDLPTDRTSLRKWLKKSCEEAIRDTEEQQDQMAFVVTHDLFMDCVGIDSKANPAKALEFVIKNGVSVNLFQISVLPGHGDVMVNTWPMSPKGWGGFRMPPKQLDS